jgi:hypothetical protein
MNGIGCRVKRPLKIAHFASENAIIAANLHPLQASNIKGLHARARHFSGVSIRGGNLS